MFPLGPAEAAALYRGVEIASWLHTVLGPQITSWLQQMLALVVPIGIGVGGIHRVRQMMRHHANSG